MEMTQHISQLIREPSPHDQAKLCQFLACTCLPRVGGQRDIERVERDRQGKRRRAGEGGTKTDNRKNKKVPIDIVGLNEGGTKQYCTDMEFLDIYLAKDSRLLSHTTVPSAGGIDKMTGTATKRSITQRLRHLT